MSTPARERHQNAAENFVNMGVPDSLAERMSALLLTRAALDIADLAAEYRRDVLQTAKIYSAFNENLGLYWLHVSVEDLAVHGRWQAIARSNLREEFYRIRREIASQLLRKRSKRDMNVRVDEWLEAQADGVARYKQMVEEMKLRGQVDFATLTVAAQVLRDLIAN